MTKRVIGRVAALLAVGLLTTALAACEAVPRSGPVREGLPSLDQVERSYMFNPSRPVQGADQEAIVRGFVRAAASSDRDYEVAREYLAPNYADQWDPGYGVLVVEGAQQFQSPQEGLAVLSLKVVASIDSGGTMTPSEPGGHTEVQFELVKVGGEWRISSAPTGIILDRPTFTAVWSSRTVYFMSHDGRLVADPRWFLNRQTMTTQIVRELIAGPSEAMSQVLHTAVPAGTSLTSGSVPVVDGVAVIDLSAELLDADEATMSQFTRQLITSLQSLPGISGYQLKVHGSVIDSGSVPVSGDPTSSDQQSVLVIRGGEFGIVSSGSVRKAEGVSERVTQLAPTAVSVSSDRSAALVLHADGVSLVRENETVYLDGRRSLLAPSIDPLGYAWLYSPSSPTEITVVVTEVGEEVPGFREGDSFTLALPWLDGLDAAAVRVSTGGNRIAAIVEYGGGSAVLVAGIVRDANGVPLAVVDTPVAQLWEQGAPIDLDWYGDTRFAALTQTGLLGGSSRVTTGAVGQFSADAGAVSGGVSIGGGGSSKAQLRVLDDQHRMFSPQGSGWQQTLGDVELIAKVG